MIMILYKLYAAAIFSLPSYIHEVLLYSMIHIQPYPGHKDSVSSRQSADANSMYISIHRLLCHFVGCLAEGATDNKPLETVC